MPSEARGIPWGVVLAKVKRLIWLVVLTVGFVASLVFSFHLGQQGSGAMAAAMYQSRGAAQASA
jgi:hypothetical protein